MYDRLPLRGLGGVSGAATCAFLYSTFRALGDVLEGLDCVLKKVLKVLWLACG